MELDVENNPTRQVSQFVNHDKLWEHEEVQVIKLGHTKCHVLVITTMGSKFYYGQQSNNTYENLAVMTFSVNLYW
jgi:hypothetical protein